MRRLFRPPGGSAALLTNPLNNRPASGVLLPAAGSTPGDRGGVQGGVRNRSGAPREGALEALGGLLQPVGGLAQGGGVVVGPALGRGAAEAC